MTTDNTEFTMSDSFGVWGCLKPVAEGGLGNMFPNSFWMLHASYALQSIQGQSLLFQWVSHAYSWWPFGMWFLEELHTSWLLLGSILWSREVLRTGEDTSFWFKCLSFPLKVLLLGGELGFAACSCLCSWALKIMPWPTTKLISRISEWKPK